MNVHVTSFYRFLPLSADRVGEIKSRLERFSLESGLLGLCLLGAEGINSTLSGTEEAIAQVKVLLRELISPEMTFKDSLTTRHPFHVFRIKIKDEIVTMGKPGFAPDKAMNFHLSPEKWHLAMKDPRAVVLDTRNGYEVEIGKFRGARDFALKEFAEFPEAVRESGIAKDTPVLMYCTGGIRCEKAMLEMRSQGYTNVHQLEGGILNYLEQFPESDFEGECFVFDYRVAVDQKLQPTAKYKLCPHCGQPANKPITCAKCGTEAIICHHCQNEFAVTCSKNCAHHMSIGSASKRAHIQELTKRHKI